MESPKTILYVDDELMNRRVFEMSFRRKFNVIVADSGFTALDILRQNAIDIVISDMKMPELNGLDFIRKAKQEFTMVSYFVLTGYGMTPEIAKAIEEKLILSYFSKPFDFKKIERTLSNSNLI